MNDAERIEAAIDRPHEQLLLLADIHAEAGRDILAEGYRLLAKHKRWPKHVDGCWSWSEAIGWTAKGYPARLPVGAPIPCWGGFTAASLALRHAALALAWWKRGTKIHIPDPGGDPPWRVMCGGRQLGRLGYAPGHFWPAFLGVGEDAPMIHNGRASPGERRTPTIEEQRLRIVAAALAACPLPESSR